MFLLIKLLVTIGEGCFGSPRTAQEIMEYFAFMYFRMPFDKFFLLYGKTHFYNLCNAYKWRSYRNRKQMLGHKNIQTTQHYAKILDQKVSEDMQVLRDKFNTSIHTRPIDSKII